MKCTKYLWCALLLLTSVPLTALAQGHQWTLKECLDYAIQNNITLQKNNLQKESAQQDVQQSRGQLLPSVSFSTSHQLGYRPFTESGITTVTNGYLDDKVSNVSYNGSYGINANWTVWNGNKTQNNIRQAEISEKQAELTAEQTANSIQEQIAQLYVQILYNSEGVKVYEQIASFSKQNLARGQEMLKVGAVAKAEVAQLEAQVATDEYNIVNAKGMVQRYKTQLKQLLEISGNELFDIAIPTAADAQALAEIPSLTETYENALLTRPEIKSAQLGIESSEVAIKIAKAGALPSIGVTGALGTSTNSGSDKGWSNQMKNNINAAIGMSVSVPIFDQHNTKTAVRKAELAQVEQNLELKNQQKQLWSTIEGYWIDATTNQERFRSAQSSVNSAKASFELLSEQFNEGLKNVTELTTGKTTLLNAQQSKLESKYTTILNIQLLKFYNGQDINL